MNPQNGCGTPFQQMDDLGKSPMTLETSTYSYICMYVYIYINFPIYLWAQVCKKNMRFHAFFFFENRWFSQSKLHVFLVFEILPVKNHHFGPRIPFITWIFPWIPWSRSGGLPPTFTWMAPWRQFCRPWRSPQWPSWWSSAWIRWPSLGEPGSYGQSRHRNHHLWRNRPWIYRYKSTIPSHGW